MKRLLPALMLATSSTALAQTDTTSMQQRVFQLGEVVVVGSKAMGSTNSLQWPKWDKESLYLITNSSISEKSRCNANH